MGREIFQNESSLKKNEEMSVFMITQHYVRRATFTTRPSSRKDTV